MLSYAMKQYYKWAVLFEFTGMNAQFGREILCSESVSRCSYCRSASCEDCDYNSAGGAL